MFDNNSFLCSTFNKASGLQPGLGDLTTHHTNKKRLNAPTGFISNAFFLCLGFLAEGSEPNTGESLRGLGQTSFFLFVGDGCRLSRCWRPPFLMVVFLNQQKGNIMPHPTLHPRTKVWTSQWRQLISRQCWYFKRDYFKKHAVDAQQSVVYCPYEQRPLHIEEATVDHIIPLSKLFDQFLAEHGFNRFNIGRPRKPLNLQWKRYHLQNARLRIVSHDLNQKLGREQEKTCGTCQHRKKVQYRDHTHYKCDLVNWSRFCEPMDVTSVTPACQTYKGV